MDHPFRGQGPLFLLLIPFVAGLLAGLAAWDAWPAVAGGLLAASVLLALSRVSSAATALAVMALCGSLTAGRIDLVDPEGVKPFLGAECVLRGSVAEIRQTDFGWSGVAEDAALSSLDGTRGIRLGRVLLSVRNPDAVVSFPAEVRATGRLHPPTGGGNPGETPREWSAMTLAVQYVFSADASKTVFLRPVGGSAIAGIFRAARGRTGEWIARHAGSSDGALYLRSLATGEVPPSSHPMVSLLRKTGLAHILAISGLNVAVFFAIHSFLVRGAVWAFRRRRGTPDLNRVSLLSSLPVCWAYVLMAGAPVSAVRAAGMITAAVLLRTMTGARSGGHAWTALFVATVLIAPLSVLSPSFLLSYGATFFLIAEFSGREPPPAAGPARKAIRWIRDAFVASAVAFLGTLPVSAAFFNGLPAGSILWNLLFGPILGTVGVAGAFLAAAGGAFSLDSLGPIVALTGKGLTATLSLLARASGDGWGYVPLPPSGWAATAFCVGAAAAGSLLLRARGKAAWPAVVLASAAHLAWIHLPYAALPDDRLTLTALNVGRGAAHVVSFPGGRTVVIDCGSALRGDAGRRIVAPHLRSLGVRGLDALVLTHPHEDHYGGAEALLDEFPVKEIWIPEGTSPGEFGAGVAGNAGRIRPKSAGDEWSAGAAGIVIRSPAAGAPGRTNAKGGANDEGLVVEIRHGGVAAWLPGDTERGPAAWGRIPGKRGERRVLFLPHHGSPGAFPRQWIRAATPDAVVSQNSDCFAPENLLPSPHAFFLENGALTMRTDGKAVTIEQKGRQRCWGFLWRLSR